MTILGNSLIKHSLRTPTAITATSGSGQSANCGAAYAAPLVATIAPALSGVSVTFTAPGSGASGTFASTGTNTETVLTVAGVATSSVFTANGTGDASAYTVTATTGALSASFSLTNDWTWAYYLTSLSLPAWWRMRDTSGTTVVNSGSLGSALDLTATAWTMAQAGQLGAGEAGLADGATTILSAANNATLAAFNPWEWAFLVNPTNAGEGGFGTFWCWGTSSVFPTGHQPQALFNSALTSITVGIWNTLDSAFVTTTTTGLAAGAWALLFVAFDGSKVYVRKGVSGAVTEFGYSAQPALTGAYRAPTSALNLFNEGNATRTFAGLGDEVFVSGGRTFTAAERLQMTLLAGV